MSYESCLTTIGSLVRTQSKAIYLPGVDSALHHKAIEAQADIWALPHINQAPAAVLKLMPSDAELDRFRI
jgi:hypothetical protein